MDILRQWLQWLYRILTVTLIMSVLRALFSIKYGNSFGVPSTQVWTTIFLQGFRFDLAVVTFVSSLAILLSVLPLRWFDFARKPRFQNTYFSIFAFLLIAAEVIDLVYFSFNSKRLTIEVFSVASAVPTLAGQLVIDYWPYILLAFVLHSVAVFIDKSLLPKIKVTQPDRPLARWSAFLACLVATVVMARGGLQNRPLQPLSVIEYVDNAFVPLVMGSAFSFVNSLQRKHLKVPNYYPPEQLREHFTTAKWMTSNVSEKRNIVLLLIESFGKINSRFLNPELHGHCPEVDRIMQKSTVFINAFANGRRSNQALSSIFASIPDLMDEPFMHSTYAGNRFLGLAEVLNTVGYTTSFFNGSTKHMLAWTEFINGSGFKNYFSREDYNNDADYDGEWGIYDHKFFKFFAEHPIHEKKPFFSVFFSLSSHHPYLIPPELKNRFSEKYLHPYYNSLEYTDYAIGEYFKWAEKQPWYMDTIFIITADHTKGIGLDVNYTDENAIRAAKFYESRLGLYSIPMIVFDPRNPKFVKRTEPVQHADLLPTILQMAGYNGRYFSYGCSLFDESCLRTPRIAHYVNHVYHIIDGTKVMLFDGEKPLGVYDYLADYEFKKDLSGQDPERERLMLDTLKAIIQSFNDALVNNRLEWVENKSQAKY